AAPHRPSSGLPDEETAKEADPSPRATGDFSSANTVHISLKQCTPLAIAELLPSPSPPSLLTFGCASPLAVAASLVAIAAPPLPSPSQRPSRHSRHASSLASHLLSPRRHSVSPPFRRSAYSGGVTSPPFLVLSRLCPILCPLSTLSHPLIPPCPIPSFRPIPSPHSALTYPLTSPCPIFSLRPVPSPHSALPHPLTPPCPIPSLRPVPSPHSALPHPLTPPCPIPSLRPAPSPHSALPHLLTILDEQGARLRQTAWTCVPPHLASAFITSKVQMSYIT
ncbi:unnamed protein product, partial [Closterium sp. NIES-64]